MKGFDSTRKGAFFVLAGLFARFLALFDPLVWHKKPSSACKCRCCIILDIATSIILHVRGGQQLTTPIQNNKIDITNNCMRLHMRRMSLEVQQC